MQLQKYVIYNNKLKLSFYIHDNDGKARNIIEKHEPEAKENLDISHMIKNVVSKISNENWKVRLKKTLFYSIRNCDNDEDLLNKNIERYLLHWKNDHSKCKDCNKEILFDFEKKNDEKLYNKIEKPLKNVQKDSELYVKRLTSSLVESINRSILVSTPKDKDYPHTYSGRVDSTFSRLTVGENWFKSIFEDFKVPLCDGSLQFFDKKTIELDKESKLSAIPEQKKKKRSRKELNKK